MSDFYVITSDFVTLNITNSRNQLRCVERKFQKGITIREFKGKLELLTGGNPGTMILELYDKNDKLVCQLNEEDRLLGSYHINDGMRVHVLDNFNYQEEDISKVEKFELSDTEYSKRTDSVKAFLERNKLGKYKNNEAESKSEAAALEAEMELANSFKIGDRCEVRVPNQCRKRGTVRFIGETKFKKGMWIGVEYDEPVGKNDGTVDGHKYFECSPKYGGFVKPVNVCVGDFPEECDIDQEL